ncbi:MAG TPA: helix-turn-helix domain-containing protein [Propionicimonas sp.]|jgi:excisionase family DNA binding protein
MTAQPKPPNQPSEYLSIAEAAAFYHVSRDYIRNRIIDGSLPAVRSGRKIIRVRANDLQRLFRPVQSLREIEPVLTSTKDGPLGKGR